MGHGGRALQGHARRRLCAAGGRGPHLRELCLGRALVQEADAGRAPKSQVGTANPIGEHAMVIRMVMMMLLLMCVYSVCVYILRGCAHGRAAQAEARGEQFLSILRPLNSLKISKRLRLLNPLKVSKHFQAPKLPSNL